MEENNIQVKMNKGKQNEKEMRFIAYIVYECMYDLRCYRKYGREEQGYVIDMHTEQQCERLCENYDIALESDEEGELARQAILVADSDEITKEDIHTIKAEYSAIVEPDYVMEAAYKTAKSDESGCEDYGDTWNLKMIHAEQLTDRVPVKPIKVAVIDSGIDFTEELNVTGRKNVVDRRIRGTTL